MIAPAKLNLCLYLGPVRDDGKHEIVSVFQPLMLADRLVVREAESDRVVCPAIEGDNLAATALERLRDAGWDGPQLEVEVEKRIPVAAGLGGGSADAAAVLRLARGEIDGLEELAEELGADVPSQIDPRPSLVEGAGERFAPLAVAAGYGIVLVPDRRGLSTADVYRRADELGLGRSAEELDRLGAELRRELAARSPLERTDLLVNDLQAAAVSLLPDIAETLDALRSAGADHAMVTGSGPTAVGLFARPFAADQAADRLRPDFPDVLVTAPAPERGA